MKPFMWTLALVFGTAITANDRPISDAAERIIHDGFPVEKHSVTTDDGYILLMHRIPYSPNLGNANQTRPVALIMHGMLGSSSDFIILGPKKALAYRLSDAGYDVWIGNARGNTYSKKHTVWPTYWQLFWNFSWNEIGIFDVPAIIDYVLEKTGETQVQYVGHSQGTTVYLVMLSEKPAYNSKIKSAHLLGPSAYMGNMKSPLTRALAPILGLPNAFVEICGSVELLPTSKLRRVLGIEICKPDSQYQELCAFEFFLMGGWDTEQLDRGLLPDIKATVPAGASLNQNLHYFQVYNSHKFRKFDYSAVRNPYKYGTSFPPNYKIENTKVPTHLYYGANDWMSDVDDVRQLIKELPNVALDYLIPFPKWSHFDFIWGTDADKYVYDVIIEHMAKFD